MLNAIHIVKHAMKMELAWTVSLQLLLYLGPALCVHILASPAQSVLQIVRLAPSAIICLGLMCVQNVWVAQCAIL